MSRRRGLGDCWSGTEAVSSPHAHCLCFCVCLCAWLRIWLCMLWVWEGNMFVLASQCCRKPHGSVCLIWRGWIPPKTFVENWFWVPFITWVLCVTVHSLCIQGSDCMNAAYFKLPRRFTEKCIWTWDWVLWIILSLMTWLFMTEVCAIDLHQHLCKQTMLTLTIAKS